MSLNMSLNGGRSSTEEGGFPPFQSMEFIFDYTPPKTLSEEDSLNELLHNFQYLTTEDLNKPSIENITKLVSSKLNEEDPLTYALYLEIAQNISNEEKEYYKQIIEDLTIKEKEKQKQLLEEFNHRCPQ